MCETPDVLIIDDTMADCALIEKAVRQVVSNLPIGIDAHLVANQPHVVEEAVGEFTKTLWEAIFIVLAVSFFALGWRPGLVVAVAIPLVLAITFVVMYLFGISLQRISLGALIIALGLLVEIPEERETSAALKELLFHAHEAGLQLRYTAVSAGSYREWVAGQGKPRHIVTLLSRRIRGEEIARLTEIVARLNPGVLPLPRTWEG